MNIISKKKLALLLMLSLVCSSFMFGQEKSSNNDIWSKFSNHSVQSPLASWFVFRKI